VSANQGLNGGVDYDSLTQISNDPNTDLYDPVTAPVFYPNRKLDITQHNFSLRTLAKPFDNSKLDFSVYYRYNLDEYRDFEDSLNIMYDKRSKVYGAALNYVYTYHILTLQLLGDYENLNKDFIENSSFYKSDEERYSYGGLFSLSTSDKMFQISLFYKQGYRKIWDYDHNLVGIDLKYSFKDIISLYAGYSLRDEIWKNEKVPSFEAGISCQYSGLMIDLKYFSNEYLNYYFWLGGPEPIPAVSFDYHERVKAFGLNLHFKHWLLLLETNTSYYFKSEESTGLEYYVDNRPYNLPKFQFIGGLYVNDLFFDNNLNLKAGFKFYYTGEINSYINYWSGSTIVSSSNKLDFTLAGEIRGAAIFYFIWENLLGDQYYITPYYPMPERNIRFGLAWELFN
jgi:hypothetical protein